MDGLRSSCPCTLSTGLISTRVTSHVSLAAGVLEVGVKVGNPGETGRPISSATEVCEAFGLSIEPKGVVIAWGKNFFIPRRLRRVGTGVRSSILVLGYQERRR